ncbi:MAG TPA: hypothetical protein VF691_22525 [Cytophagaceae bacterium]
MRKSKLNLVNELRERLTEFPQIVNQLETKDPLFKEKLLSWIKKCEELLTTHNVAEVSELAGLRSKIIGHGVTGGRGTASRKESLRIAAEVLYDVQKTTLKVYQPINKKIEELRELTAQLLLLVSATGEVRNNVTKPFDLLIDEIWRFILRNEQLKAGAIKLKTVLSPTDIQLLLAQEINLEDFSG